MRWWGLPGLQYTHRDRNIRRGSELAQSSCESVEEEAAFYPVTQPLTISSSSQQANPDRQSRAGFGLAQDRGRTYIQVIQESNPGGTSREGKSSNFRLQTSAVQVYIDSPSYTVFVYYRTSGLLAFLFIPFLKKFWIKVALNNVSFGYFPPKNGYGLRLFSGTPFTFFLLFCLKLLWERKYDLLGTFC